VDPSAGPGIAVHPSAARFAIGIPSACQLPPLGVPERAVPSAIGIPTDELRDVADQLDCLLKAECNRRVRRNAHFLAASHYLSSIAGAGARTQ
jgi:hypothetical protein